MGGSELVALETVWVIITKGKGWSRAILKILPPLDTKRNTCNPFAKPGSSWLRYLCGRAGAAGGLCGMGHGGTGFHFGL